MPYAFVRLLIALFLLVRHRYKRSFLSFHGERRVYRIAKSSLPFVDIIWFVDII
ncbi:hypothetical protein A343_1424 [Porphyromonas gingivalis JCVI SC001]|nr:hypothetical protein A343_1424 [Porphyromonas gingivalis JCVI SC001]